MQFLKNFLELTKIISKLDYFYKKRILFNFMYKKYKIIDLKKIKIQVDN